MSPLTRMASRCDKGKLVGGIVLLLWLVSGPACTPAKQPPSATDRADVQSSVIGGFVDADADRNRIVVTMMRRPGTGEVAQLYQERFHWFQITVFAKRHSDWRKLLEIETDGWAALSPDGQYLLSAYLNWENMTCQPIVARLDPEVTILPEWPGSGGRIPGWSTESGFVAPRVCWNLNGTRALFYSSVSRPMSGGCVEEQYQAQAFLLDFNKHQIFGPNSVVIGPVSPLHSLPIIFAADTPDQFLIQRGGALYNALIQERPRLMFMEKDRLSLPRHVRNVARLAGGGVMAAIVEPEESSASLSVWVSHDAESFVLWSEIPGHLGTGPLVYACDALENQALIVVNRVVWLVDNAGEWEKVAGGVDAVFGPDGLEIVVAQKDKVIIVKPSGMKEVLVDWSVESASHSQQAAEESR